MPTVEEQLLVVQGDIKELTTAFNEHRETCIRVEERAKSNTTRLNEVEEQMKENSSLISAIKELAVETKYMRADINDTMQRLKTLESRDGETWRSFKWLILATIVGIVLGALATKFGIA